MKWSRNFNEASAECDNQITICLGYFINFLEPSCSKLQWILTLIPRPKFTTKLEKDRNHLLLTWLTRKAGRSTLPIWINLQHSRQVCLERQSSNNWQCISITKLRISGRPFHSSQPHFFCTNASRPWTILFHPNPNPNNKIYVLLKGEETWKSRPFWIYHHDMNVALKIQLRLANRLKIIDMKFKYYLT